MDKERKMLKRTINLAFMHEVPIVDDDCEDMAIKFGTNWDHRDDEIFFNYVTKRSKDIFDCETFNKLKVEEYYFSFIDKLDFICQIGLCEYLTKYKANVHFDGQRFTLESRDTKVEYFSKALLYYMSDDEKYGLALYFCKKDIDYPVYPEIAFDEGILDFDEIWS